MRTTDHRPARIRWSYRPSSIWMLALSLLTLAAPPTAAADEPSDSAVFAASWPNWRGPRQDGSAPQANPPVEWSDTKNVEWKLEIPGEGHATPVVWNDRIFLLTAVETDETAERPAADPEAKTVPPDHIYQFLVMCIDRTTGREIWRRETCRSVPREGRHTTNTYASGSPVTDGRHVYAFFGSRGVYCLDLDGQVIWQQDLGEMRTRNGWGEGASPALASGHLIVNWDAEEGSFIIALDAATGQTRWKAERPEPTSWATPLVVEFNGRHQVIVNGTERVRSYDLATGEVLWECGGQTVNAIPSPVQFEDLAIAMSGYRGSAVFAIPLSAQGDVTDSPQIAWQYHESTPYVPSPVVVGNRIYFTRGNNGILTCLNARTGELVFGPERLPAAENIYASPVAAQGRIYFVGRDGTTVVVADTDSFKVLAVNPLNQPVDASPVLVGDQLLLRSANHLFSIRDTSRGATP